DLAVEPRVAREELHTIADVADDAELEAVDDLLAEVQLRRAPPGLDRDAGVVLLRAEQRGRQQHAPVEQLPLRAELERARALRVQIRVALGEVLRAVAERVAGRVRRRAGRKIDAAVRSGLVDDPDLMVPEVGVVLDLRRRVDRPRELADLIVVVAQAEVQLPALRELDRIERIERGRVRLREGRAAGRLDRPGPRIVRIRVRERRAVVARGGTDGAGRAARIGEIGVHVRVERAL